MAYVEVDEPIVLDSTGQDIVDKLDELIGVISPSESEVDSIALGYLSGRIIRCGDIRIITLYDGVDEQTATNVTLNSKDVPSVDYIFGNWVMVSSSGYGSRYITVSNDGKMYLSGTVYRGGFTCIYKV